MNVKPPSGLVPHHGLPYPGLRGDAAPAAAGPVVRELPAAEPQDRLIPGEGEPPGGPESLAERRLRVEVPQPRVALADVPRDTLLTEHWTVEDKLNFSMTSKANREAVRSQPNDRFLREVFDAQDRHKELTAQLALAQQEGRPVDALLDALKSAQDTVGTASFHVKFRADRQADLRRRVEMLLPDLRTDPLRNGLIAAQLLDDLGHTDEAERVLRWHIDALSKAGDDSAVYADLSREALARLLLRTGRPEKAIEMANAMLEATAFGGEIVPVNILAQALLLKARDAQQPAGRQKLIEDAREMLRRLPYEDKPLLAMVAPDAAAVQAALASLPLHLRALVHACRGEHDLALDCLHEAMRNRPAEPFAAFRHMDQLRNAARSPFLASLHDQPRWQPFLECLFEAPADLATIRFTLPPLTGQPPTDLTEAD